MSDIEKKPRLFYMQSGCDVFKPAPSELANLIDLSWLGNCEMFDVSILRIDMTDNEFESLPIGSI